MNIPIDGIQAFIQVAELGSFHGAADKLGLTQTGLSRRIQRLEAHVGSRLFDRTTRFIALTAVGREFLPQATRLVEDLTSGLERLRTMSRLSTGDVTIACLPSLACYQLPLVLRVYAQKFPDNRVQLLERTGAHVTEGVRQGQAEFGIHIQQQGHPDLLEEPIMRDPFVLFCHRSHALSRAKRVTWKDLRHADLITLGGASGHRRQIEEQLARAGLNSRGRFVVENFSSAIGLAAAGAGIAILPASTRAAETHPKLRQIPLVDPIIHRAISLIRRRDVSLAPAAQALYEVMRRELAPQAKPQRPVQ